MYQPLIREVAKRHNIRVIAILPDITNTSIIEEMSEHSGISVGTLQNGHDEALAILNSIDNLDLTVRYISRTPPYIYMRMGETVAFKLYPNHSVNFQEMPMFTCSRHSKLGELMERDVEGTYA